MTHLISCLYCFFIIAVQLGGEKNVSSWIILDKSKHVACSCVLLHWPCLFSEQLWLINANVPVSLAAKYAQIRVEPLRYYALCPELILVFLSTLYFLISFIVYYFIDSFFFLSLFCFNSPQNYNCICLTLHTNAMYWYFCVSFSVQLHNFSKAHRILPPIPTFGKE